MGKSSEKSAVEVAHAPVSAADGKSGKRNAEDDIDKAAKKPKTASEIYLQDTKAKTISVENLAYNVDKEQVKQFFQEVGEIIDIHVAKGFTHVEFATPEAAHKACELNGNDLMGQPVRLKFAQERAKLTSKVAKKGNNGDDDNSEESSGSDEKNDQSVSVEKSVQNEPKTPASSSQATAGSKIIFVGNLEYIVDKEQVRQFFQKAGEIVGIRASKGFTYVQFATTEAAHKACELNGNDLVGRPVRITFALERAKSASKVAKKENSADDDNSKESSDSDEKNDQSMSVKKSVQNEPKTPASSSQATTGSKTIFCWNLAYSVDKDQVKQFFQEAGEIIDIRVARSFAHVEFATTEAAHKACELNGNDLMGQPVRLKFALERGKPASKVAKKDNSGDDESSKESCGSDEKNDQSVSVKKSVQNEPKTPASSSQATTGSKTIFCWNLAYSVDKDQVKQFFQEAGEIIDIRVARSFAHVEFATTEAAHKACELNGNDLMGQPVRLKFALERAKPASKVAKEDNSGDDNNSKESSGSDEKNDQSVSAKKSVQNEEAGEIIDIRIMRGKCFAHVEFATTEAAHKACKLNDNDLMSRPVRLRFAQERGAFTRGSERDNSSLRKRTAFVTGFDSSLREDELRSSLEKHFSSCGEITRVSIPMDYEIGATKGIAFVEFSDKSSLSKAKELSGSDLGGFSLIVKKAKRQPDNKDVAVSNKRGRSGKGRSDDRGLRRGRSNSHGHGKSFGRGDRGGRVERGHGGRSGAPHRQSALPASTGKKITFGDD